MKHLRLWGLSTALLASGGAALAGDPNMGPDQTTLVNKLFGPKSSKPSGSTTPATPATITAPLSPETLAKCLHAEQEAYLRRVSICTELRRVAEEKADTDLGRQADAFEREAANIYNARVAALGLARKKAATREPAPVVGLDELGDPKVAANRLNTSSATTLSTLNESTSEIKEVKP